MTSCVTPHQKWYKKGQERGWIKDSVTNSLDTFYIDSNKVNNRVDTFLLALWDTLTIESPCDSITRQLTPKAKSTIKYMIKERLVPVITYPPDTLKFKNKEGDSFKLWFSHGKAYFVSDINKQIINVPDQSQWDKIKETWWLFIAGMGTAFFIVWLITRKQSS